jgi:Txe/YoeB family toxin of Txe-Axe toxin-antitoxin module
MRIEITDQFKEDIATLRDENVKLTFKVWELIFSILESPYQGLQNNRLSSDKA